MSSFLRKTTKKEIAFGILKVPQFFSLQSFKNVVKGDTGKQALKHICQRFFNFQPIFLKLSANASFFKAFLTVQSDLT